ncbi:MAG: methylenetetrahydrofolate--tRNA-(uracil(54)-C(5))-methyltransferase (FADH(2)-oxidizing) TrmFO [bacterium]|nr:MAG: methylenetetrahydrofolate--tRNA-(uracil(54)-C(5))-methyltransferase (FADH(2)-oxidizing) TrmFO [bacterium]
MKPVRVIGGGLAGCEAAWQISRRGYAVELLEMRPGRSTPAHRTADLAELVCSNSLKSTRTDRANGLLKEEMRLAGSLILEAAAAASIPGGSSLCVDRNRFSSFVEGAIRDRGNITVRREEVTEVPRGEPVVIATGPLTSDALSASLQTLLGLESLFFYDAIAPTIDAESIDWETVFVQDRYQEPGSGSYVNCPLDREQYRSLVSALRASDTLKPRDFEDERYFEACLPIEVMASRGVDTLAFGPMRPVGLTHPATGRRPHAVVQLRPENREGTMFSMVGFQTRLSFRDQEAVFRTIPGLEKARFERMGTIHRNTYVDAPSALDRFQRARRRPGLFFSGQLAGVEGYVESAASGLMTGLYVCHALQGREPEPPPPTTMIGAILDRLSCPEPAPFQPVNAQFGLLPPPEDPTLKKDRRREALALRALDDMAAYLESTRAGIPVSAG